MLKELTGKYNFSPQKNPSLNAWRTNGRKAVGYVCTSIPEEMIHASGMLPVRLWGSAEEVTKARGYCAHFTCHVVQSILDMGLKGELACLDGLVVDYGCEAAMIAIQPLVETVKFDFLSYIQIPHTRKPSTPEFYRQELLKFKQQLEKFTGVELTDQRLRQSILVYNTNRALLRRAYALGGEGKLTGREVAEAVSSSSLIPKEMHNQILSRMISVAEQREPRKWRAQLHVSGTMLPPGYELFDLVEGLGATVVSDDLCTGSRYFWQDVDAELPPLEAFVDYILYRRQHCPYVFEHDSWDSNVSFLKDKMQRFGAQGVLFLTQKWCDAMNFQLSFRERELDAAGIPWIGSEVESTIGAGQLQTRLEALVELIEAKKTLL